MSNMKPEKKDVWEEFKKWQKDAMQSITTYNLRPVAHLCPVCGIDPIEIEDYIRQNFIPRAEVVEMVKKLPQFTYKKVFLDDVIDLLTQQR